jgi:DNA-binding CsgD family transcriptional regulator
MAAHMILLAADFNAMMQPALSYLCTRLGATRCDTGLGRPQDLWFVSTAQQTLPGAKVLDVVGLRVPNQHAVPQASWHSTRPLIFDVGDDPGCEDLKAAPALAESQVIMVRRLAYGPFAVGQVCADQVNERRPWVDAHLRVIDDITTCFMGPLAFLHAKAQSARGLQPTPAELDAIRLIATGLSYKEVARELGKSVRTISNQLTSARTRLGARNELELVRLSRPWLDG